jgi:hypothetical protein
MRIEWGKKKSSETPPSTASDSAVSKPAAAPTTASGIRRAAAVPAAPTSLAQVLIQEGNISPGQMKEALEIQKKEGGFLGQILIDKGCFDENSLTSFLAKQCKIPHLSLLDYLFEGDMFEYIPREVCVKLRVLPIDKLGKNLTVGMVNPLDAKARDTIRDLCPDLRIKPILCAYSHFKKVMEKFVGEEEGGDGAQEMSLADYGLATPEAGKSKTETPKAEEPKKEKPPAPVEEPVVVEPTEVEPIAEEIPVAVAEPDPAEPALDGETVLGEIMSDESAEEEPHIGEADPSEPAGVMEEMLSVMRDSMRDTYAVLARRMVLFRGLSSEEVAKVFASGMTAEHDVGETIFEKGDKSDDLHVVLSGKVDVIDDGRTVASIEAGGLLGEMAWISDEPRSATAVVVEPTSLITLSDDVFKNLVSKEASIQLLMNIILTLTERLRIANESK